MLTKFTINSIIFILIFYRCIFEIKAEGVDDEDNCGQRKVKQKIRKGLDMGRLVGGVDAAPNEFPWQVSLLVFSKKANKLKLFCAGALVNKKSVLTAAHCVYLFTNGKENQLVLRFGSNNWMDESAYSRNSSKILLHPNWNRTTHENDLAIVTVDQKIDYKTDKSSNFIVNRICLPKKGQVLNGSAVLAGFGQMTAGDKDLPEYLQKIDTPLMPFEQCRDIYKRKLTIIDELMICAGKKGSDACLGDSGGSLSQLQDGHMVVIGVVSFGPNKCGATKFPSGYTRVSSFIDWIKENSPK